MRKRWLPFTLALFSLAAPAIAATVPRPAPDFAVNLVNGSQLRVSQFKGKVCAVIFILTTCPHCQKTIGYLIKNQNEYGPRGFQVVASAIEQGAAVAVPGFINAFKPTFPVGYNLESGPILEFMQHPPMLIPHMPLLTFIDRQGRIRAQYEGLDKFMEEGAQEQNLRNQIESLLKEPDAPPKKAAPKKSAAPVKKAG